MESLPSDCPPSAAEELAVEKVVFRIATNRPPAVQDFYSQRRIKPNAKFRLPECLVCGVSVYSNPDLPTELLKLPKFKGMYVAKVQLMPFTGFIQKTFGADHYTLWPFSTFHPVEVVDEGSP